MITQKVPKSLLGEVSVGKALNKDGSYTLSARWNSDEKNGHYQKILRTPPNMKVRELRPYMSKARKYCEEFRKKLLKDYDGKKNCHITVDLAVRYYKNWIGGDKFHDSAYSTHYVRDSLLIVNDFARWIQDRPEWNRHEINEMNEIDVRAYRNHMIRTLKANGKPMKRSTILKKCRILQAFLDFCHNTDCGAKGRWIKSRFRVVSASFLRTLPPEIKKPREILEDSMVQHAIEGKYGIQIHMMACLGLRLGETNTLRIDDFDGRILTVPYGEVERTKKHGRSMPVGPRLSERVQSICGVYSELPIFRNSKGNARKDNQIYQVCKKVGFTPHDLRRWFYSKLLDIGCPGPYASILMGHTLSKNNIAYATWNTEKGREYVEKIDSMLS